MEEEIEEQPKIEEMEKEEVGEEKAPVRTSRKRKPDDSVAETGSGTAAKKTKMTETTESERESVGPQRRVATRRRGRGQVQDLQVEKEEEEVEKLSSEKTKGEAMLVSQYIIHIMYVYCTYRGKGYL